MEAGGCIVDLGMCTPPAPPEALPTRGIRGEKRLLLNGETIVLKAVENAHSGADLFVYLEKANVVYTGDIYFGGMYPVIDRNGGGTVNGMLHALRQILASIDENTVVVPSHGELGNRQSVLAFTRMLETAKERVRRLIAEGLTEEQILAAQPMADFDADWGSGFVPGPVFTRIVYRDLALHGKSQARP
jgi:glyoxylase-like metal-dependent hydrolase (beta-lactamase superfamily II)